MDNQNDTSTLQQKKNCFTFEHKSEILPNSETHDVSNLHKPILEIKLYI